MALMTLISLVAVLLVGPLVLACYEVVEYNFCQLELKHCVDAAALAAACGLTASTSSSVSTNELYAMNQALAVFQKNTVLGHPLTSAAYTYATTAGAITNTGVTVGANQSALYFEFMDPYTGNQVGFGGAQVLNGNGQQVALNTAGKILRTIGYFGFVPQFVKFVGLANSFTVTAQTDAGMPQLDLVFCYDTSCSMDDFTNIALVNRYNKCTATKQNTATTAGSHWDTLNKTGYTLVAIGQLNSVLGATGMMDGCPVNAGFPMQQDACAACAYQPNFQGHGWNFDQVPYYSQGDANFAQEFPANTYTDLVVPLDGNGCQTAVSVSLHPLAGSNTVFTFPAGMQGIAVLVEAQRANLENVAFAANCNVYTSGNVALGSGTAPGVTCASGWFQAYFAAVMGVIDQQNPLNASLNTAIDWQIEGTPEIYFTAPVSAGGVNPMPLRHPLGDCLAAVENFFQAVWNDADVHYGLVVYNDQVGAPTNSLGNVSDPTIYSGTADSYNGATSEPVIGSPVPGAADYATPQFNLYSKAVPIQCQTLASGYAFTNPTPPDRSLVPLPQLLLQKSPGASLSCSLFDTTIPPAAPTAFSSVNYALYNYTGVPPNCNNNGNVFPPYCVEPFGGTNMTAAINAAVAQFSSTSLGGGTRLGATPAIVLFTDGVPSSPDTATAAAAAAAQSSRTSQNLQAIPIYCVGLAAIQASGFQSQQLSCLQGISGASGIGATSFQVAVSNPTLGATDPSSPWNATNANSASQQLDVVFQNIARQLVGLVN